MRSPKPVAEERVGRNVFLALAVATAVEFVVATSGGLAALVVAIAVIKAWLIVVYFMHVGQLRRGGD